MSREATPTRARSAPPRSVRTLRALRLIHTYAALPLLALIVASSATGLLLGWKKNSAALQPPTQQGRTVDVRQWRPLHEVAEGAQRALAERRPAAGASALVVERMDVRPGDGIVKVLFPGYWEVQVDPATAEVLSVARRNSDWIEKLHDGSIVGDLFKLVSMTLLSLGLIALSASGFWMWYGPRRIRRAKRPG